MLLVIVKTKNGFFYNCQCLPNGIKCGKCKRGRLEAKQGARCRVCGAKVSGVYESGAGLQTWPIIGLT